MNEDMMNPGTAAARINPAMPFGAFMDYFI